MNRIEELEAEVARLRERVAALEEELGVPVVTAVAVSGQGIRELAEAIPRARVPPPAIRGEVRWFAAEMERKLRLNDRRGGWAESHQDWLLDRLRAEARELDGALQSGGTYKIIDEAADVANFAMMIADNARRRAGDAPKEERCHVWGGDVSRWKLPEFAPTGNAGDPGANMHPPQNGTAGSGVGPDHRPGRAL